MKKLRIFLLLAMLVPTLAIYGNCSDSDEDLQNIVVTAEDAGDFNTLLAALEAADLIATLEGPGPFTVFAPTDEAFDKLPEGTIDALLMDIPLLTEILLYHVLAGNFSGEQLVAAGSAETLEGSDVSVTSDGNTVMVNDATVIFPDVPASNGTIHIIDTVLMPPM